MSEHEFPSELKDKVSRLPGQPGVYRMLDARAQVIYVGKARDLRKRVGSYFTRQAGHSPKVRAMVLQIADLEVVVTRNENEALILESNLIKELRPRYNVVLRDDKSYPYIYVTLVRATGRGATSGLTPAPAPFAPRSTCCRNSLRCASAKTVSSAIARDPACNIRSSAAPDPAWGW